MIALYPAMSVSTTTRDLSSGADDLVADSREFTYGSG